MVVNECVINTCSDITYLVNYELYNNLTSVYLKKSFMHSVNGKV